MFGLYVVIRARTYSRDAVLTLSDLYVYVPHQPFMKLVHRRLTLGRLWATRNKNLIDT